MNENERNFIIELEALSRKYKLQIGGCGCCGSPRIDPLKDSEVVPEAGYVYVDQIQWASPDDCYWEKIPYRGCSVEVFYKDIVVGKEKE